MEKKYYYSIVKKKKVAFYKCCDNLQQYTELLKTVKYLSAIPAHNANAERIFSVMNILLQWTDERNRMEINSVKWIVKFYNYIKITKT